MGVALCGADLAVAEQSTDHFQRCPARDQQRGEGVAQVVDADVRDVCLPAHPLPEAFEVNHRLARHITEEEEAVALGHGIPAQAYEGDGLVRDWHPVVAALLDIGGLLGPDGEIKVELVEGGGAGFAAAGAGQHADPTKLCCAARRFGGAWLRRRWYNARHYQTVCANGLVAKRRSLK